MYHSRPPRAYSAARRTALGLALGVAAALVVGHMRASAERERDPTLVWVAGPSSGLDQVFKR